MNLKQVFLCLAILMGFQSAAKADIIANGPQWLSIKSRVKTIVDFNPNPVAPHIYIDGEHVESNFDNLLVFNNGVMHNATSLRNFDFVQIPECTRTAFRSFVTNENFITTAINSFDPNDLSGNYATQILDDLYEIRIRDEDPESFKCAMSRSDAPTFRNQSIRISGAQINFEIKEWNEFSDQVSSMYLENGTMLIINGLDMLNRPNQIVILSDNATEKEVIEECIDNIKNLGGRNMDFRFKYDFNAHVGGLNTTILDGTNYSCEPARMNSLTNF